MKSPGEALTARGRRPVSLAIIALAAIGTVGMKCQPKEPSFGKTGDKIHRSAMRLAENPPGWEAEFLSLEASLDDEPELRQRLAAYRTEAVVIRHGEPGCTTWVDAYMLVVLIDAFAESTGVEYEPPDPLCPTVPASFDAGDRKELVLHGFTIAATKPSVRVFTSLGFSPASEPDTVTTGRYVFSSKSFLGQACGIGHLVVYVRDEEFLSVQLTAAGTPARSCVADIDNAFAAVVSECTNDCCNFATRAQCIEDRCEAECEQRKRDNTKGHPAIGDACSESGAYYQWCHSDCAQVSTCQKRWCGDDSPLRKACISSAEITRAFDIEKCPTEYRCDP